MNRALVQTKTSPQVASVLTAAVVVGTANWALARPSLFADAFPALAGGPLPAIGGFGLTFLLLGVAPALGARSFHGVGAVDLGLRAGRWRTGLVLLGLGIPVAVLAGWAGATSSQLAAAYPIGAGVDRTLDSFAPYAMAYAIYYLGYEFFFRGWLLLGLRDRLGAGRANLLQAVLSVLIHVGKPLPEILAAGPASLLFGWVTLRTGSIWYAVGLHWAVGVAVDWFALAS